MDGVQRLHVSLLRRRTAIRNHSSTQQWMKRCWRVVPHGDPALLSIDEYEVIYATLLYEMTVCWEDDTSDIVLAKMWRRDASSFDALDFDRFCCSLFRYVEMWIGEVVQEAYDYTFALVYAVLSGHDSSMGAKATATTIKPTLESVSSLIDHEKRLDDLSLNLGKSVLFDASEYVRLYGAPPTTAPLDVTSGSPGRRSSRESYALDGVKPGADSKRPASPAARVPPQSARSPSRYQPYHLSEQEARPAAANEPPPPSKGALQLAGQAVYLHSSGSPSR